MSLSQSILPFQSTPSQPSSFTPTTLGATDEERGRGESSQPSGNPRKRSRRPTVPEDDPVEDEILADADADLDPDADSYISPREMLLKLTAENMDLKHQISIVSSQMTTLQTSLAAQLSALTAQVATLGKQVARNNNRTNTPNPPPAGKPAMAQQSSTSNAGPTGPKPKPKSAGKPTYAGVTSASPPAPPAVPKKAPQILRPRYDPVDQKVILQIHPDTPPKDDIASTWKYLQLANTTVREYNKEPKFCFVRCHITSKQNIVLQTSITTRGADYTPYLDSIKNAFQQQHQLNVTTIDSEPRWSKFLLHGVPTTSSMAEVALSIQQSYPDTLTLAQTPRWLTTDSKRLASNKGISTVVLSISGKHTLESLGHQYLFVCNNRCRLDKYLPFGPNSQCGNCCRLGHPTGMCPDKTPTCGVCGKDHSTRFHLCPAVDCKGGGRCTHAPTYCVNCKNSLHNSVNPACPQREKARLQHRRLGVTTEYDTSVPLQTTVTLHPPENMNINE
jgi:hypothetical protein